MLSLYPSAHSQQMTTKNIKYEEGDLNPHGSPRWNLNPVRLPIPPPSHKNGP